MSDENPYEKIDEILSFAKSLSVRVSELQTSVESLKREVEDLHERQTYRERVLIGWKEIAAYMGVTERYAQELANLPFDRLPVLKEYGRAVAFATALDAHRLRHRNPLVEQERRKVVRLVPRESDENPS